MNSKRIDSPKTEEGHAKRSNSSKSKANAKDTTKTSGSEAKEKEQRRVEPRFRLNSKRNDSPKTREKNFNQKIISKKQRVKDLQDKGLKVDVIAW